MAQVNNETNPISREQRSSNHLGPDLVLSSTKETATSHTVKQTHPGPRGKETAQRTSDWVHHSATYCPDAQPFDQAGHLKRTARLDDAVGAADRPMKQAHIEKSRATDGLGRLEPGGAAGDDLKGVGAWAKKVTRG